MIKSKKNNEILYFTYNFNKDEKVCSLLQLSAGGRGIGALITWGSKFKFLVTDIAKCGYINNFCQIY